MAKISQLDFHGNFELHCDVEDLKAVEHIAAARQVPITDVIQAAFHAGLVTLCRHDKHHSCRVITQESKHLASAPGAPRVSTSTTGDAGDGPFDEVINHESKTVQKPQSKPLPGHERLTSVCSNGVKIVVNRPIPSAEQLEHEKDPITGLPLTARDIVQGQMTSTGIDRHKIAGSAPLPGYETLRGTNEDPGFEGARNV